MITAASNSRIELCAFKVAPGQKPKGCAAIYLDIGVLEIERCWFEGFDNAIDVAATHKTNVRIAQTMIVRASVRDPAQFRSGEGYGWGVKLRFVGDTLVPSKKAVQPNVFLDHCTLEGAGLIDLTSSPGPAPLEIEIRQCALRAGTLLAVNPNRPPKTRSTGAVKRINTTFTGEAGSSAQPVREPRCSLPRRWI